MDNLTHSLAGWVLGQTGLKRKSRKGLAALILGANMPDIDVFFGWVAWEPLATHRGFTHGLVGGVLLMPPLLAGLLWLLDRWQQARGATFSSGLPMRFGWLVVLSYLGAITHPLLDWQTTYSVQLFSPLNRQWYHADTLFIIDLWVLLALGGAIALSRRRERSGANWQRPASAGIALVLAFIGTNSAITADAKAALREREPMAEAVYASSPPVLFWRRELAWREGDTVAWADYDPLRPAPALHAPSRPASTRISEPLVRRALATPEARSFARWSTLPLARITQGRCASRVSFGDARYGRSADGNRLGRTVMVPNGRC